MTRQMSPSMIKGSRHALNPGGKPREGTKLRQAYDALRRGEIVKIKDYGNGIANQLTLFYGMDLERVTRKGQWQGCVIGTRLLGEWIGDEYVPIEHITAGISK